VEQPRQQPAIQPVRAPREPGSAGATQTPMSPPDGKRSGGFWSFLRTFFVGTVSLAVLGVIGTIAGSAWLTANQRAEADKPQPWANPSFTTTAVTTGGLLARWMDNDGNLDNGHSYIKGIYDLWKVKQNPEQWTNFTQDQTVRNRLPQMWQIEFLQDSNNVSTMNKKKQQEYISSARENRLSDSAFRGYILALYNEVGAFGCVTPGWQELFIHLGMDATIAEKLVFNVAPRYTSERNLRRCQDNKEIRQFFSSPEVEAALSSFPPLQKTKARYTLDELALAFDREFKIHSQKQNSNEFGGTVDSDPTTPESEARN
jgi:hypothetical protein